MIAYKENTNDSLNGVCFRTVDVNQWMSYLALSCPGLFFYSFHEDFSDPLSPKAFIDGYVIEITFSWWDVFFCYSL